MLTDQDLPALKAVPSWCWGHAVRPASLATTETPSPTLASLRPPILLCGLDCMPISGNVLHQLQRVLTRQLRAVARSQAHLTRETTISLRTRLRVPFVLDVRRAASKHAAGIPNIPDEARNHTLVSADWAMEVQEALLACGNAHSQEQPFTADRLADTAADFPCQVCDYVAPNTPSPHVNRPGQKAGQRYCAQRFQRELRSVDGMPTCRLCGHAFSRWTSLRAHINAGQCPQLTFREWTSVQPCFTQDG